jgi:hypothetical protein
VQSEVPVVVAIKLVAIVIRSSSSLNIMRDISFLLDKRPFIPYTYLPMKNLFARRIKMMTISPINRKNILFFFAIMFLFASLAMTFHHHDDGCQHDECSLCIAANLFSSGNLEIHESFVFYPTTTYFYQPEEPFHQALSKFPIYSDRAPPVAVSA